MNKDGLNMRGNALIIKLLHGLTRVVIGLALLLAGSSLYQAFAIAADAQRFPPPGLLVDVGGYRLHLECFGQRATNGATVVFEGGLGAPALMWSLVQQDVAEFTRVCRYDRAGYGWSDPSPQRRTAQQIAEELHLLLDEAGEAPPYLFVGHALAGISLRVYVATYPEDVFGVLLIDPRHEDFFQRMPAGALQVDEDNLRRAQALRYLTPLGLTRWLGAAGALPAFENYLAPLPEAARNAAWAKMIYNPQHWATALAEREASAISYQQAREATWPAAVPLLVLSTEDGMNAWRAPNAPADEATHEIWMTLQQEVASRAPHGEWRIIPGGHYPHLEQPTVIVDVIRAMTP